MSPWSLILIPYGKTAFTIELHENEGHQPVMETIIENSKEDNSVFSDLSYEFRLKGENLSTVRDVYVYINDVFEISTFNNGYISFPGRGTNDRRVFLDCYGFVELNLILLMEDGTKQYLSSGYLPVLVHRGELNESVKAMVTYVYNHQDALLLNGQPKPRNLSGLKESKYRNLTSQIMLAEKIAKIYENSFGYFKVNSRFHIEKIPMIDHLERLQYVTPATLNYVASHPEQLKQVNGNYGIRIGNRIYHPEKTLSLQNVCSHDIYENRVVIGFLRKMVDAMAELRSRCENLLEQIPDNEDYSTEYVYSSFFMFAETRRTLEEGVKKLSLLHEKYVNLYRIYSNVLPIPVEQLVNPPRLTAIFMSVPQYNKIYVCIHQWLNFGIYNFEKESFMLSFIKISSLYESYLLAKLIAYFRDRGYLFIENRRCIYPVLSKWKYKNTSIPNTYLYSNGQSRITLYYQPVIFDTDQSSVNGIGLYRNNSIPVYTGNNDDGRQGGHYYVPDFLIKVDNGEEIRYLIIDAKFSDINSVKRHYVKDLTFKYLFSISTIDKRDTIEGLCIIYGKCRENEQMQSVYDKKLQNNIIVPLMELFPLMEDVTGDKQYGKLDALFQKISQKNTTSRE